MSDQYDFPSAAYADGQEAVELPDDLFNYSQPQRVEFVLGHCHAIAAGAEPRTWTPMAVELARRYGLGRSDFEAHFRRHHNEEFEAGELYDEESKLGALRAAFDRG